MNHASWKTTRVESKLELVSKLVYSLLTGLTAYLNRGYSYNQFTKYHEHPCMFLSKYSLFR